MLNECNVLECDVYSAIKVFKNRWISVILFSLNENPKTFTVIHQEFSFLSNSQLANSLNKMCIDKIIVKDNKQYRITKYGTQLVAILLQLETWYQK